MFESFSTASESTTTSESGAEMPANFHTVVQDFIGDLNATFPEYSFLWKRWVAPTASDLMELFLHFTKVLPERFFDILYQNDEIFDAKSELNTQFLPNVDFRILFHCPGVSETTRSALWKYLQLILVTILSSVKDKMNFGETADLFAGLDEAELQTKLSETIRSVGDFFKNLSSESGEAGFAGEKEADEADLGFDPSEMAEDAQKFFDDILGGLGEDKDGEPAEEKETHTFEPGQMPNAEDLHEHLKGLFDGKIGSLAKELAEEISGDMHSLFGTDGEDVHSTEDVLKKMLKNPKKIMDLMKTIGGKLTNKMKSGDISEADIMKEATELLGKMKSMGGKGKMGEFSELFKKMAKSMGGGMGDVRMNMGALNKMEKQSSMKQRMLNKLEQKRQAAAASAAATASSAASVQYKLQPTNVPNNYVFRVGDEKQEKSVKPITTTVKSDPEVDLESLAKEIEQMSSATPSVAGASSHKKKANRKKK
jgi:hypothetical protein